MMHNIYNLVFMFFLVSAIVFAGQDPYQYLQSSYTVNEWIPDPAKGTMGKMMGASSFLNGTVFGVIYESGAIAFFYDGATTPFKVIGTSASHPTGITEVPTDIYPGPIVVTDGMYITYYDFEGNEISFVSTPYIFRDITYDIERKRLIISTETNGVRSLWSNGADTLIGGSAGRGMQNMDLGSDSLGREIDDLHQSDGNYFRVFKDGTIGSVFNSNFGADQSTEGIAYTKNNAYAFVNYIGFGAYILRYNKLAFQNYMNYSVGNSTKVTLLAPDPNTTVEGNITFEYTLEARVRIDKCSLLINDEPVLYEEDLDSGRHSFIQSLPPGRYEWCIKAENVFEKEVFSQKWTVIVQESDSIDLIDPAYAPVETIPVADPEYGNITAADGLCRGRGFVIGYDSGRVEFYADGATQASHTWQTGREITGIAAVPSLFGHGGTLAISDSNSIAYYYAQTGEVVHIAEVIAPPILDITWDQQRQRMLVSTMEGIGSLNEDGTVLSLWDREPVFGIELIDMSSDPDYDDLLQAGNAFVMVDPNGFVELSSRVEVDFGIAGTIEGIAYTREHLILADAQHIHIFDRTELHDHIETRLYPYQKTLTADLNDDGAVDLRDLLLFSDNWLNPEFTMGDWDENGEVDLEDFGILSNEWMSVEDGCLP